MVVSSFVSGHRSNVGGRFSDVFEEIAQRLQAGESVDLQRYAAENAECASELRRLLPTLEALAELGHAEAVQDVARAATSSATRRGTLGDYQIIREIGRGGMGVVYEAEELSLHRRVALKVLPFAAIMDGKHLARFKNEAVAAASLKHPNIVGVHAVGCERGVHYYAMEYVEGESLADLIRELQKLSKPDGSSSEEEAGAISQLARDLTTGRLGAEAPTPRAGDPTSPYPAAAPSSTAGADETPPDVEAVAASTDRSTRSLEFFRAVARLGIQAAEALEHAHQLGVVHRDIKPSNLLVDAQGHLWVTDFGLAMTSSDSNLTMTGDVVGTLRYMSPEQASGRRTRLDFHTDIYSLGVTLYELLTLAPAYPEQDRQQLLRRILEEEPRRPRQLNCAIPKDLETIVLKATAKEPAARYSTAQQMAGDLRRFVNEEPIQARRPTVVDRVTKWCRRHKAATWSAAAVLLLISIVSVLSTLLISTAYRSEAEQRHRAETAQAQGESARKHAEEARDEAYRNLFLADMGRAPNLLAAGEIGRLRRVLDRHVPQPGRPDLRGWEWCYLLGQCRRDLLTLRGHTEHVSAVAWSPTGNRIASASFDGTVRIWDATTGEEIRTLRGHNGFVDSVAWSPTGARLASGDGLGKIKVWDPATGETSLDIGPGGARIAVASVAWSPTGRQLASAALSGPVRIWDAETGKEVLTLPGRQRVAWCPDGKRIASLGENTVKVWDSATGSEVLSFGRSREDCEPLLAWSPDGGRLATAGLLYGTRIWDAHTGKEIATLREDGYVQEGRMAWSPDGTQLAVGTQDATTVWNTKTWREIRHVPGDSSGLVWSPDGERMASPSKRVVKIWDANYKPGSLTLPVDTDWVYSVAWNPDGTRIAAACGITATKIVKIWDANTWQEIASLPQTDLVFSVAWSPNGQWFAAGCGDGMIKIWDANTWEEVTTLRGHRGYVLSVAWSPDGSRLASGCEDRTAKIWDTNTWQEDATLQGHPFWVYSVDWSPDGKRFASGGLWRTVKIWETASWREIHSFSTPSSTPTKLRSVAWRPDSAELAVRDDEGFGVWHADSWNMAFWAPVRRGEHHSLDWSPDGTRLASTGWDSTLRIWEAATGEEILTFREQGRPLNPVAWSADGQRLAAGGPDGIKIWDASIGFRFAKTSDYLSDKAEWLAADGRAEEAAEIWRKLAAKFPDVPMYFVHLARQLAAKGRHADAIEILEQRVAAFPDERVYEAELAAVLVSVGGNAHAEKSKLDEAIAEYNKALQLDPENAFAHHQRGHAHRLQRDFREAIADFTVAIRLVPERNECYISRAVCYIETGAFVRAIADCNEAIRLNPLDADAYVCRGNAYRGKGDRDQAIADYNEAIRLDPQDAMAYNDRGVMRSRLGEYDQAIADYTEAIRLDPDQPKCYCNRGFTRLCDGDYDEAMADFDEAIRGDPMYASAYHGRGIVHSEQGELDKAIADFAQAAELTPAARLSYRHALALLRTGDLNAYRKACADMLQQFGHTEDPETAHWVAWTSVLTPDAVEDPNQIVQLAQMAVDGEREPLDVTTLGAALYRAGQYDQAIKCLSDLAGEGEDAADKLTRSSPAYTWFFLAMAHHRSGHHEEAKEMFDKAAQWMDSVLREHEDGTKRLPWNRRLTLKLFRAEAADLLGLTETTATDKGESTNSEEAPDS